MPIKINTAIPRDVSEREMKRLRSAVQNRRSIDPDTECHNWTGAKNKSGYGVVVVRGKHIQAHRLAMALHTGSDPGDMLVLHRCDNPSCVNPAHLFLGTHGDNALDAVAKKRHNKVALTHCPSGHEYTECNLYFTRDGYRICRKCKILAEKRRRVEDPEGYREAARASYERNRDAYIRRATEWHRMHPERSRQIKRESARRRKAERDAMGAGGGNVAR